MKVDNFYVTWKYFDKEFTDFKGVTTIRKGVSCIIDDETDNNETFAAAGIAICSPNDNFNKEVGRKISFEKAVKIYPKKIRTKLWEGFRTMTKNPKWDKL